jgi:hypothetical protein
MYNIDVNSLTPEERAAYEAAIARAVAENRSLNVYANKYYSKPEQNARHLQEQRNIMALGIPPTTDLWGELEPSFEINNRIPGDPKTRMFTLGETYGMTSPGLPDREGYGLSLGLNLDAIGNAAIKEMQDKNLPVEAYKGLFQKGTKDVFQHEREHSYLTRRVPFGGVEDVLTKYIKSLPKEQQIPFMNASLATLTDFKNLDPLLAEIYVKSIKDSPGNALGIFEEAAARSASTEGFNWLQNIKDREELQKYIKWKKTGLFE